LRLPPIPALLRGPLDHSRQAFRRTEPIAFRTPLALLLISLTLIASAWSWLAKPVTLDRAPIDTAIKLDCVSYAPFRGDQTPLNQELIVSPAQIREDLLEIARISNCIRTYSVDNGLDKVPELASQVGLKVLLGVWIGNGRRKNAQLVETAVKLAKDYPDTIRAIVVGNEVLLHGDMTPSDLRELIRSVKARVTVPVTYADVWEFWLRYREVQDSVDFITAHVLPYWEDSPVRAEDAAAHVAAIQKRLTLAFPGKEILIGETGWPSMGRMREGALPSRTNQARVLSEILDVAKRENFHVNLIEAYDASWKRYWEGTVGGNWGLFDADHRELKYPPGVAVSNYPSWKPQMGIGMALAISVFGAAWLTLRRRPWPPRPASWIAVAMSATTAGILFGVAADKVAYESYGVGGWLERGSLLAVAIASPVLCAGALMSGRSLPTFLELFGPREGRTRSFPTLLLGLVLTLATLLASQTALGALFDARWRDFPFAALTMVAVPFSTLALFNRPSLGSRPMAEALFSGLFTAAAVYTILIEGTENWQALWTSAAYLLFAATLWQARCKDAGNGTIDADESACRSRLNGSQLLGNSFRHPERRVETQIAPCLRDRYSTVVIGDIIHAAALVHRQQRGVRGGIDVD
jgi:exo-beta-1,3-glucanase (GH17 family)